MPGDASEVSEPVAINSPASDIDDSTADSIVLATNDNIFYSQVIMKEAPTEIQNFSMPGDSQ